MRYHITPSQMEILQVMWKTGIPLTRAEILEKSTDKTWKDNSIHILLNGMLEKGLIEEAGFVRSGKVWGRKYSPVLGMKEYYTDLFRACPHPDLIEFVECAMNDPDITVEIIDEMLSIVANARVRMKSKSEIT